MRCRCSDSRWTRCNEFEGQVISSARSSREKDVDRDDRNSIIVRYVLLVDVNFETFDTKDVFLCKWPVMVRDKAYELVADEKLIWGHVDEFPAGGPRAR